MPACCTALFECWPLLILQVLYAHIFGVFLLNERETVWGVLGSLLIAAGVVTLNDAQAQTSYSTAEPLPRSQYSAVSTADRNVAGDSQMTSTVTTGTVAESGAEEPGTVEAGAGGSSFLQALLTRIRRAGLSAAGTCPQQQEGARQAELAGTVSAADTAGASRDDGESSGQEGGPIGSPCQGQLLIMCHSSRMVKGAAAVGS